jgi:hypothetical protein
MSTLFSPCGDSLCCIGFHQLKYYIQQLLLPVMVFGVSPKTILTKYDNYSTIQREPYNYHYRHNFPEAC